MKPLRLKNWHPFTGVLHFFLAFFTTLQIITSFFTDSRLGILIHGIGGCGLFLTVVCAWLWNICHERGKMLKHLYPYKGERLQLVKQDILNLFKFQLPKTGYQGGLPGLVEGLGLLAVTGMALTGICLFIGYLLSHVHLDKPLLKILDVHGFLANFVWVYWFGHVGMACIQAFVDRRKKLD